MTTWTIPAIKPITREGVPTALQKAHRYRLLNDSVAAESICLDVLSVEPTNEDALITHVLAITDQFAGVHGDDRTRAIDAVARLTEAITEPVSIAGATGPVTDTVNVGVADPTVRLRVPTTAFVTVRVKTTPARAQ